MRKITIKGRFLQSTFFRVFNIIKKNPKIYVYTIVLDFIFLALILFVGKYFGSLIPQDPQQIIDLFKTQTNLLLFVIIYPIIYYLFVIFIYSITKSSILNLIKPLYENNKFSLKGFGRFYLLNLLLFIIFFSFTSILFGILALILTRDFLNYLVLILLIPLIFFIYSIINIAHTLFIKDQKNKILKISFNIAFNKINRYGMFIVWDVLLIFIYLLFYNIIHLFFRFFIFSNKEVLTAYGSIYLTIFNITSIIFVYLIIAFNRIYFYERIDKNVLQ